MVGGENEDNYIKREAEGRTPRPARRKIISKKNTGGGRDIKKKGQQEGMMGPFAASESRSGEDEGQINSLCRLRFKWPTQKIEVEDIKNTRDKR